MGYNFNISKSLKDSNYQGKFKDSLQTVLKKLQTDPNINNIKEAAYLLATAQAEADYSLTRWESDYICEGKGIPYKNKPCQKALDYYRSTNGKSNYYNKGVDSKGLPYFGRGLIQLTGKNNYTKYGELLNKDLVKNPELALKPKYSYKIASEYLKNRTFKHVRNSDFAGARKSVKGKSDGWEDVKKTYDKWIDILERNKINNSMTAMIINNKKPIIITATFIIAGVTGGIIYAMWKKKKK